MIYQHDEVDGPNPDYTECIYGVKPGMNDQPLASVDWTKYLIEVDNGLDESDVEQLKFLLRGCISDARLKKLTRGTDLFQDLHNSGYIDIDNGSLDILEECLYRIHRKDLIRKLAGRDHLKIKNRLERYKQEIKRKVDPKEDPKSLLPFRVMLFEIGEDIDDSEFKSAIFALGSVVPKGQLQKMDSIFDLFLYLEKKDELSHENVEILPKVLKAIDRGDLIEKVRQYQNNYNSTCLTNVPLRVTLPLPRSQPQHYQFQQQYQNQQQYHQHVVPNFQQMPSHPPLPNCPQYEEEMETEPRTPLTAGTESVSSQGSTEFGLPKNKPHPTVQRQLSKNFFFHLAPDLAKKANWEEILIDLGLTKTDLDSIRRKSRPEVFYVVNNALLYWQDKVMNNSEECTKRLIDVLQRSGMKESLKGIGLSVMSTSGTLPGERDEPTPVGSFIPPPDNETSYVTPITPPNADSNRRVMETQTSMLFPQQSRSDLIRDDDLPNRAVTHAEAQVSMIPEQLAENTRVQSARDIQTEVALAEQLRAAGINDEEMDMPSYKMDTKPRGIAVIINNEKFFKVPNDRASKEMPPRVGTEKDADNLVYIFRKLDFLVERFNDLQDYEIVRKLVEVAYNRDHTNYDCLVVCILSHGVLGHVYGTNGRLVNIKDCTGCFRAQMCPTLAGKPKLFFIQACQGRDKQGGHEIEKDSDLEMDNAPKELIPDEADFVLGYATVPGYVSYRSRSQGSWYVNKLVQMLEKYSARYDLLSILIKVNEEVGRANAHLEGGHYKQIPAPLVTLRKRLYFR